MRRVFIAAALITGLSAASADEVASPKLPDARTLFAVPVSPLLPGNAKPAPQIASPVAHDPDAPGRGMQFFTAFNCVGCHAPNGGGGMGPSLSNRAYIYGGDAANIFLSIYQGRPNGMPAWGSTIPESAIWDLVSYVQNLSQAPAASWGTTYSPDAFKIEQVPAQASQSDTPWKFTEQFSFGQKPNRAK